MLATEAPTSRDDKLHALVNTTATAYGERESIVALISRAQQRGSIRTDVPPEVLLGSMVNLLRGQIRVLGSRALSAAEVAAVSQAFLDAAGYASRRLTPRRSA